MRLQLSQLLIIEMKRNCLYILYTLIFMAFLASCSQTSKECRIHGVMQDKSRDGKTIYLVPMENSTKDNVDSTIIKDGKFEFVTQKHIMAIVRVKKPLRIAGFACCYRTWRSQSEDWFGKQCRRNTTE